MHGCGATVSEAHGDGAATRQAGRAGRSAVPARAARRNADAGASLLLQLSQGRAARACWQGQKRVAPCERKERVHGRRRGSSAAKKANQRASQPLAACGLRLSRPSRAPMRRPKEEASTLSSVLASGSEPTENPRISSILALEAGRGGGWGGWALRPHGWAGVASCAHGSWHGSRQNGGAKKRNALARGHGSVLARKRHARLVGGGTAVQ